MICTDLFSGYRIHDRLHACIYISYAVDNLQFRDVHTHVWVGNALCTGMHSDGNVSGAVEHLGLDLQKRRARGRRARGRQPGVGTHSVAGRPREESTVGYEYSLSFKDTLNLKERSGSLCRCLSI